ncbi:MAG TPA: ArsA-related P-loop ATPase [Acidimicrobiia bacterium]|nr:ArsA-related P-loop ATPase [Acidimicrobiia bacterium]
MTAVTLVMGAGGVGKTTIAAGIAALGARRGERTLVITVDPARRLADALGTTVGPQPHRVAGHERLDAAMLDAAAAWEGIARAHAAPATADRLVANSFFRAVADRFPSGQAYAAGEQVLGTMQTGVYDQIVVDTPPAAAGIAFLTAPARIRALVSGRALRVLTGPRLPGRRLVYSVTARPALRIADAVLGGRLLEDLAEFLIDLSETYPGIARRSREVEAMLSAARMAVVATPDPGPADEARRILAGRSGASGATVAVFNRTLPRTWAVPAVPAAAALASWGAEAARHELVRADFATHTGLMPLTIPWLEEAPQDPAGLADLMETAGWEARLS